MFLVTWGGANLGFDVIFRACPAPVGLSNFYVTKIEILNWRTNHIYNRGATTLLVAAMQARLRLAIAQAKYCNSFQLMHMPRGTHAQSIASNGDQKKDKTLLQHSQRSQHGECQSR